MDHQSHRRRLPVLFMPVLPLLCSPALFSVMCYNVLCDKYATRQLYGYCPSWALNWEYRKKSIMQEILTCNADIISLQVRRCDRAGKSYRDLPPPSRCMRGYIVFRPT